MRYEAGRRGFSPDRSRVEPGTGLVMGMRSICLVIYPFYLNSNVQHSFTLSVTSVEARCSILASQKKLLAESSYYRLFRVRCFCCLVYDHLSSSYFFAVPFDLSMGYLAAFFSILVLTISSISKSYFLPEAKRRQKHRLVLLLLFRGLHPLSFSIEITR